MLIRSVGTITYWIEPDIGILKAHYNEMIGGGKDGYEADRLSKDVSPFFLPFPR